MIKKDKQYIHDYWQYLKQHQRLLIGACCLIPLISLFSIIQPYLLKKAIDDAILKADLDLLLIITIILGVCILGDFLCKTAQMFLFQYIGQKTVMQLRLNLFTHILGLSSPYYDRTPTGVTTSRLTSDIESLNDSFASGLVTLIADILTLIGIIIMMLILSPKLTIITLCVVPPMMLMVNFFRVRLRYCYNKIRSTIGLLNATIQEQLQGIHILQLYQQELESFNEFNKISTTYKKNTISAVGYDAILYSLIESINSIMIALMIWYGWGQYQGNYITLGILVAFIDYIHRFFTPLKDISSKFATLQHALAALEKIFSTFEINDRIQAGLNTRPPLKGNIIFNDVSFAYKGFKDKQIIKNVSFTIKAGQWVAIVGPTGSGKTSILRLISKLYDGYSGSIKMDNHELSDIELNHLRNHVTVVNQDNQLFSQSIAFNISLGHPNITPETIKWAAKCVNIHEMIMNLPNQYDTILEHGNQSLSAGQAQLISFARALASPNPIILLDEATANVDSLTERDIQQATQTLLAQKTAIVVAHRLSTIQQADIILALNEGKIIEYGTHKSLLKQNGFYANLFHMQFASQTL